MHDVCDLSDVFWPTCAEVMAADVADLPPSRPSLNFQRMCECVHSRGKRFALTYESMGLSSHGAALRDARVDALHGCEPTATHLVFDDIDSLFNDLPDILRLAAGPSHPHLVLLERAVERIRTALSTREAMEALGGLAIA